MRPMPSLPRSFRGRVLSAAILAIAVLVASLAAAQAQLPHLEVTIVLPKGQEVFAYLDEVGPDVNTDYEIRERGRPTRPVEVQEGVSIWKILHSKSLDEDYGAVEIERPNGTTLRIESSDVDDAFFYHDPNGDLRFFRVSRGPDDYNAKDHFRVAGAVTLTQTPVELKVKLTPSERKIEPGESVDFDVEVSGGPAGARYRFDWSFGDGSRESGASAERSHVFDEQGIYSVTVTAKVRGSSLSGDANVVDVEVGDPKEPEDDAPAGSGTSGGAGYAPSSSAPYTPSYTPPATSTPTSPTPVPPSTPAPKPPNPPDIATSGTTVEGNLLADVGDAAPSNALESAARAARDDNPKDDDGPDGADVPEAALSIAGVLALLGLGAGIETRQGRLPRLRRPRLALPRRGA